MLAHMSYTAEQRQRIGRVVHRRRIAAGLGKEEASEKAGVNSITWKRIEDAEPVRDGSLGKVLGSLGLDPYLVLDTSPEAPMVLLREASDDELMEEIASRLAERHEGPRSADGVVLSDDAQERPVPFGWARRSGEQSRMSGNQ